MAEAFSLGTEPNEEMFLRDGTLENMLPPLQYSGGYIVYKQGQSAIRFFVDRYGEDRLRDLLRSIRTFRNFDNAFQRTVGIVRRQARVESLRIGQRKQMALESRGKSGVRHTHALLHGRRLEKRSYLLRTEYQV